MSDRNGEPLHQITVDESYVNMAEVRGELSEVED